MIRISNNNGERTPKEFIDILNSLMELLIERYPKLNFSWGDTRGGSGLDEGDEHLLVFDWDGRLYNYYCWIDININLDARVYNIIKTRIGFDEETELKIHPLHSEVCWDIYDFLEEAGQVKNASASTFITN
ncbi:hypothetical protein [Segetibacter aerophilus]|uniref:Uncharacterized protein n=1 Tax=Segetibacter aerophilus TaxID=670293 RepID=A0A512B8M0_9BACT|nr:hypothetical protein [Segetibacter aerophilus]GEO08311.1 hypothetical protein SAE01_08070 [Segetibacter aerophilus]